MAILVWAVESALLGLWATALSTTLSTRFHVALAMAHLIISTATAVIQLLITTRNPARTFAVAQAFVCAVAALALVEIAAVLYPPGYPRAFDAAPSAMALPLGAVVGFGMAVACLLSAVGMALGGGDAGQKSSLFLHPVGFHVPVAIPCLYVAVVRESWGVVALDLILWVVAVVFYAATGCCCVPQDPATAPQSFLNCDTSWRGIARFVVRYLGSIACALVPVITWLFCAGGADLNLVALVALVIAGMNLLRWASFLDWALGSYTVADEAVTTAQQQVETPPAVVVNMMGGAISAPIRWRNKVI
jgi:hypothetical protein